MITRNTAHSAPASTSSTLPAEANTLAFVSSEGRRDIHPHLGPGIDQFSMILIAGDSRGVALLVGEAMTAIFGLVEALADLPEPPLSEIDDVHLHDLVDLAGGLDATVCRCGTMVRVVKDWRARACNSAHNAVS